MYGALLVVVLIALGGVVAFLGDRVGMRVGRRRITLFNLRPKYTSILITIFTGVVIVAATLGVMAIVSQDVRTALFSMKELQNDLKQTRGELERTEAHASELTNTVEVLVDQVSIKEQEYQQLVSQYESTQAKLDQVTKRRASVEKQLVLVTGRLDTVTYQYDIARQNLAETENSLAETEENLRFAQARMEPLTEIQSQLTSVIDQLTLERERLNREVEALTAETMSLQEGLRGMLGRQVVFHTGEIVLATVIDGGRSTTEITQELLNMHLKKANELALTRGALVPGSETDALRIRPVDLDEAVAKLVAFKGKAVLRVLSSTNTVAQEPVLVTFQILPDELIFTAGDVIAEASVNSNADSNAILEKILALLEEVNWRAIVEKGMVSDLQGIVGQISSWQEVQDIISRVKSYENKTVVIQACAEENTWRAQGPLKVTLQIKE
ncbi:MAG TPA: hypothetical protein DHD79_06695 [Firmicutes bacterium]|jgi:uncharacterized protein (DUF3084 family)|nr:hypothetical protein [Bacillota bacterium]HAW71144.1 hypothetical protein [Bacillota bacterium]HAZ21857.1 hypothetical protein [Bacillota bacterium]HBE05150.1 hypothetical protein [Bacillota bacterium]HBG44573.1 hypothetical protein [Bacillota bacterium]